MSPAIQGNTWIKYITGLSAFMEGAFKAGINPVINLKADIEVTGTGKINDPYIVK